MALSVYVIEYLDASSFESHMDNKYFRSYRDASQYLLNEGAEPFISNGKYLRWDTDEEYTADITELREASE